MKVLLFVFFLFFSLCYCAPKDACGFCRSCQNDNACHPSVCPICPTLDQAFSSKNTLIVKVNITSRSEATDSVSFFVDIEKFYMGKGSGSVFEILPQSTTYPCFTDYYLDEYLMAFPFSGLLCEKKSDPGCFYVKADQCNYFKLWKDLTAYEIALLASHNGTTVY